MSVQLVSKQGIKFEVPSAIGKMSELIQNVIENDPDATEEIPLAINTEPLKCVLDYCAHYNYQKEKTTIVSPLVSCKPEDFITDEWERKFIT